MVLYCKCLKMKKHSIINTNLLYCFRYKKLFAQYVEDQAFYSDLVVLNTAEVAQHTEDLHKKIRQNQITYNKQLSDFNTAIDVLDYAIQLLSGLRNPVLLQTESDQVKVLANKLNSINLKSHSILYQPIVDIDIFLQMAQIILQIKIYQRNYQVCQMDQEIHLMMVEMHQQVITIVKEHIILKFQKHIIKKLMHQLMKLYHYKIQLLIQLNKQKKTELLNNAQANLNEAKETLQQIEECLVRRKAQHATLLVQYEKEQALIAQTIVVLQRGGAKRQ